MKGLQATADRHGWQHWARTQMACLQSLHACCRACESTCRLARCMAPGKMTGKQCEEGNKLLLLLLPPPALQACTETGMHSYLGRMKERGGGGQQSKRNKR